MCYDEKTSKKFLDFDCVDVRHGKRKSNDKKGGTKMSKNAQYKSIMRALNNEKTKESKFKKIAIKAWNKIDVSGKYNETKYGVRNLIKWLPIIWKDRDWDEYFLLRMMEKKFKNMSEYHGKYGITDKAQLYKEQLARASQLTRQINGETDYYEEQTKALYEKGKIMEAAQLENELYKKDLEELTTLIKENLNKWWD